MIRPAVFQDINQILLVAKQLAEPYPLKVDNDRMLDAVTDLVSHRTHYGAVDERQGRIVGVLLATVGTNMWAQRRYASVVLWWSRAGHGDALLRDFRRWVESRRAIRVAGVCIDTDVDPRVYTLLERVGFKVHGKTHMFINGAT